MRGLCTDWGMGAQLRQVLRKPGRAVLLAVGGAEEALLARPGTNDLILNKRHAPATQQRTLPWTCMYSSCLLCSSAASLGMLQPWSALSWRCRERNPILDGPGF